MKFDQNRGVHSQRRNERHISALGTHVVDGVKQTSPQHGLTLTLKLTHMCLLGANKARCTDRIDFDRDLKCLKIQKLASRPDGSAVLTCELESMLD